MKSYLLVVVSLLLLNSFIQASTQNLCECSYSNNEIRLFRSSNENECQQQCESVLNNIHIERCKFSDVDECQCEKNCIAVSINKWESKLLNHGGSTTRFGDGPAISAMSSSGSGRDGHRHGTIRFGDGPAISATSTGRDASSGSGTASGRDSTGGRDSGSGSGSGTFTGCSCDTSDDGGRHRRSDDGEQMLFLGGNQRLANPQLGEQFCRCSMSLISHKLI
ncbi:hypothetical protein DLAC_00007 [Tieghemostelium lacteum]|uniref:Uncharacterized protein n=1 Tax=Tieghemostelium lacteum TaxID=361077 RepID=A0A152A8K2_TIELA|nr:hypothetical protein DLAC_00007 [Tieghemostelium lacteum]|eukprot:KYR02568.1 hypothetical protein DLAC_00007 [Tieghemostelium lacteum]